MNEGKNLDFIPITAIFGIPHSSYGLQLGTMEEFVALTIYSGKKLQDIKKFTGTRPREIDTHEIVSYVLLKLLIPNINPRGIDKTVRALIAQLRKRLNLEDN